MLTNELIKKIITRELDLQMGAQITVKSLWRHLVINGYRPNMIRFMEALAVRFPDYPILTDDDLKFILGSEQPDLAETELKITEMHLAQKGDDLDDLETKGKYVLEVFGIHFIRNRQEWSEKTTKLFTMGLL